MIKRKNRGREKEIENRHHLSERENLTFPRGKRGRQTDNSVHVKKNKGANFMGEGKRERCWIPTRPRRFVLQFQQSVIISKRKRKTRNTEEQLCRKKKKKI